MIDTLETERLILRPWREGDAVRHAEMMADENSVPFITPDGKPQDINSAWRIMCGIVGHGTLRGYTMFAVEEKASGDWVGRIGPWYPEGWPGIELGWGLHPDARGKGYASEGGKAALAWMFDRLKLDEVISLIHPDNTPSVAVAKRLGQRHVRDWTHPFAGPLHVYGITRDEARARGAA